MKENQIYVDRLVHEFTTHGKILLALDWDSTLNYWNTVENAHHIEEVRNLVRRVQEYSHNIIFTACNPDRFEEIREKCKEIGIRIDSINENAIKDLPYGNHGKVLYNSLLDDRAGLLESMNILETAYYIFRGNEQNKKPLTEIG